LLTTAERHLTMSLKKKVNLKRRAFTKEFKLKVLAEVDAGIGLAQVARKY
jgi:transposase-like protein